MAGCECDILLFSRPAISVCNEKPTTVVSVKNISMRTVSLILSVAFVIIVLAGCQKSNDDAGNLSGVWVKGPNFGDTLWFMKKDGHNVLRKAESFNPGLPVYSEKEYQFNNGKLRLQSFAPSSPDFYDIDSFTWTQMGTEFKVQGVQLFMFMSSTSTYFTYRKL